MKLSQSRFDPSELSPADYQEVKRLLAEVFSSAQPAALIGPDGERHEFPEPVYHLMKHVLRLVGERKMVFLIPEDEAFTTQAAADFLGMSRPFLVTLLEQGKIPFHRVGSHRRIYFRDLVEYQQQRTTERRAAMDGLTDMVLSEGLEDDGDAS